ncbi:hypothetical protein EDB19DRAFT_1719437 [Suillus lakei]|nr:hypothetical protein EDB19DRAFT_1719437 [Suillus lakei]
MAAWNVVGEIANVGGVASVVQLSLQVIFAVNSYASSVAGAEAARMSLYNELLSINRTLSQIYLLAQPCNAGTSTPENDTSSLDGALKECEKTLQYLRDWIPESKHRTLFGRRLVWPFQQADIMKAVGRLERCKSTLSLSIFGSLLPETKEQEALTKGVQLYVKVEAASSQQAIGRNTNGFNFQTHPLLDGPPEFYLNIAKSYFSPLRKVGPNNMVAVIAEEELREPATFPTITSMHITHDAIPQWPIDMTTTEIHITVGDILRLIHSSLQREISHSDWAQLSQNEGTNITRTYMGRYRSARRVRRVDYLLNGHIFKGLVKAPDQDGVCHWKLLTKF